MTNKYNEVISYINKCIDESQIPGCDIAILKGDSSAHFSLGNRQIKPTIIPNTKDTIWDLASLTKVVSTTTCILKMYENNEIKLTTRVSDILEKFPLKDITIHHLLTHTSGLHPDIVGYKNMTSQEMIESLWHLDYYYLIGSKVVYSDVNFILLGLIIEKFHHSIPEYINEICFKPLNMNTTMFKPDEAHAKLCASYEDIPNRGGIIKGVVHDGKCYKLGGVTGHAGLFSTLNDLEIFTRMILNDGSYNGITILKKSTIDLLKKCQTKNLDLSRTYGWFFSEPSSSIGNHYSDTTLFHTGFSGPSILIDFKNKLIVIILTNRVHPSRDAIKFLESRSHIHTLIYECEHLEN